MVASKFLFTTFEGGGNTPAVYLLARTLVRHGHQITIMGEESQATRVHELGAQFMPLILPEHLRNLSFRDRLRRLLFSLEVGETILDCIRQEAPDALVIDCMMATGLAAAEYLQLPSAAFVHVLYHTFALYGSHDPGTFGQLFKMSFPAINEMRSGFGLPPINSTIDLLNSVNVALVSAPREFDLLIPDLPKNVCYSGPIVDDVPADRVEVQWKYGNERPRIVVSLSTTYQSQEEALRRIAAALAELPVQAVMTIGHTVDLSAFAPASNVAIHRYIPHRALLPGCSGVVTHCGLGTVLAALAHGLPMLCMPMGRDQNDNAARVAACGAGVVLAEEASVEEIGQALQALLAQPSYGAAARRMAVIIAGQDGLATAIRELETLLT